MKKPRQTGNMPQCPFTAVTAFDLFVFMIVFSASYGLCNRWMSAMVFGFPGLSGPLQLYCLPSA